MSEETKAAINMKSEIRSTKGIRSSEYKEIKTSVKQLCKTDKENMITREHRELNDLPPDVKYYTVMKRMKLSREKSVKSWGIKSKEGIQLSSSDQILDRWAEFYKDLYLSLIHI